MDHNASYSYISDKACAVDGNGFKPILSINAFELLRHLAAFVSYILPSPCFLLV